MRLPALRQCEAPHSRLASAKVKDFARRKTRTTVECDGVEGVKGFRSGWWSVFSGSVWQTQDVSKQPECHKVCHFAEIGSVPLFLFF